MAQENNQFRKDVQKAKEKYSKRRRIIILGIMSLALVVTLFQTFLYSREKKQVSAELTSQNQEIEQLDKENKVNEVVIDKLKDPYFISDLVRQEYGLSYEGETIFNLPQQENFLQSTINSIMEANGDVKSDNNGRIDDSKVPELNKKDDSTNNSSTNATSDNSSQSSNSTTANNQTQNSSQNGTSASVQGNSNNQTSQNSTQNATTSQNSNATTNSQNSTRSNRG